MHIEVLPLRELVYSKNQPFRIHWEVTPAWVHIGWGLFWQGAILDGKSFTVQTVFPLSVCQMDGYLCETPVNRGR